MSIAITPSRHSEIEYPDSDGKPMSDNTRQFEWIVTIKEGLEAQFRADPLVFVGGDLLWYPQEGKPKIRTAPDAMVVLGRPKGYRGSYKQWEEGGIAPQVVFEVLSPGNRPRDLVRKFKFYDKHGVDEYYRYDPDNGALKGWLRGACGPRGNRRDERPHQPTAGYSFRARRRTGQLEDHRARWSSLPHLRRAFRGRGRDRRRTPRGKTARAGEEPTDGSECRPCDHAQAALRVRMWSSASTRRESRHRLRPCRRPAYARANVACTLDSTIPGLLR